MVGSAAATVAEIAGVRRLIALDKGHKLEVRTPGSPPAMIETRPVTEFSAAVDGAGRLHVAAWLLSRHLMYYTSADGLTFTRSTLLKSDGGLRLKDCLVTADSAVCVAYVAETEYANTLVCYRYDNGEWEGRRIVEVELPQRLTAWQFDGPPGGVSLLYGVKDAGRTVVMARPLSGETGPEAVATVTGGLSDFCALTSGGVRQACWIADGHLVVGGARQTEEPWSRTWPHLRRGDNGGVQCLWMEDGMLCGMQLGAQRAMLHPAAVRDPLSCMMALPGELRKAVVESQSLMEPVLQGGREARPQGRGSARVPSGRELPQGGSGEITLTDVVRNQAIYLTRMQESLAAAERNMLRLQAEVSRLGKEVSALLKAKAADQPEALVRAAGRSATAAAPNAAAEEELKKALEIQAECETAPEPPSQEPVEAPPADCVSPANPEEAAETMNCEA